MQAIPEDAINDESDDEDKSNPDERISIRASDKRIAPDNEYSDSEDEGDSRRDQRYIHSLFLEFYLIAHTKKKLISQIDLSKEIVNDLELKVLKVAQKVNLMTKKFPKTSTVKRKTPIKKMPRSLTKSKISPKLAQSMHVMELAVLRTTQKV